MSAEHQQQQQQQKKKKKKNQVSREVARCFWRLFGKGADTKLLCLICTCLSYGYLQSDQLSTACLL
jgi:hypothetical protein